MYKHNTHSFDSEECSFMGHIQKPLEMSRSHMQMLIFNSDEYQQNNNCLSGV